MKQTVVFCKHHRLIKERDRTQVCGLFFADKRPFKNYYIFSFTFSTDSRK